MQPPQTKIASFAPYMFATAMAGFGVQSLITGKFLMTRAPIQVGGAPAVYVVAVVLIAAGVLLLLRKNVLQAGAVLAMVTLVWAVVPHVPSVVADRIFGGPWTNSFKGLSLLFGCFVVAICLLPVASGGAPAWLQATVMRLAPLCRFVIAAFLLIGGIQHFKFAEFVQTLVPAWIPPNQLFWTYFAGVALVLAGVGLMLTPTSRLAAFCAGIMVLTWFAVLHIPRALATGGEEWIGVLESLALASVLLMLSAKAPLARS